jgi:hypothetical protein
VLPGKKASLTTPDDANQQNILESLIGDPIRLTNFILTIKNKKIPEMAEKQVYKQVVTYLYLRNSDSSIQWIVKSLFFGTKLISKDHC